MAILLLHFILYQCQAFVTPQALELFAHSRIGRGTAIDIPLKALKLSDQTNPGKLAYI
jgi:hypothetical protein